MIKDRCISTWKRDKFWQFPSLALLQSTQWWTLSILRCNSLNGGLGETTLLVPLNNSIPFINEYYYISTLWNLDKTSKKI